MAVVPYPGRKYALAEVKSIEWQHKRLEKAVAGYDVGLLLSPVGMGFIIRNIKKGFVVSDPDNPPRAVRKFRAILHAYGKIKTGQMSTLHCHQASVPCRIVDLGEKRSLNSGERKEVVLETLKPLVIEDEFCNPKLGRFILRNGSLTASGMCTKIIE